MSARLDLEGKLIGNIQVVKFAFSQKTQGMWWVICPKCECGFLISSCNLTKQLPTGCQTCYLRRGQLCEYDDEIVKMYKDKRAISAIANELSISRKQIYASLLRKGIKANRKLREEEKLMLYHYVSKGVSYLDLEKVYDRKTQGLKIVIKKLKLLNL